MFEPSWGSHCLCGMQPVATCCLPGRVPLVNETLSHAGADASPTAAAPAAPDKAAAARQTNAIEEIGGNSIDPRPGSRTGSSPLSKDHKIDRQNAGPTSTAAACKAGENFCLPCRLQVRCTARKLHRNVQHHLAPPIPLHNRPFRL